MELLSLSWFKAFIVVIYQSFWFPILCFPFCFHFFCYQTLLVYIQEFKGKNKRKKEWRKQLTSSRALFGPPSICVYVDWTVFWNSWLEFFLGNILDVTLSRGIFTVQELRVLVLIIHLLLNWQKICHSPLRITHLQQKNLRIMDILTTTNRVRYNKLHWILCSWLLLWLLLLSSSLLLLFSLLLCRFYFLGN